MFMLGRKTGILRAGTAAVNLFECENDGRHEEDAEVFSMTKLTWA
jgi:hypothetical protein